MAENIVVCSFLGICSLYDCRTKLIPVWLLRIGIVTAAFSAVCSVISGTISWAEIPLGLLPGSLLLLYSHLTQGKLGEADGWMAMTVGLLHQWERCAAELTAGCFLTFIVSAVLLITRRGNRSTKLPFAPFFLAGVILLI